MRVLMALLTFSFSMPSLAQYEESWSGGFFQGLEVIAGSEVPFQLGAKVKFQLPANIHMTAGLGYIPAFYAEGYGTVAGSTGILGENTGELAAKVLESAFVIDIRAAYSLDPDGGFYLEGGYAFITGGSGSAGGNIVESAYDFDYSGFDANDSLNVEGSLHALTIHLGYLYLISERMSLNFDVGIVKPVSADISTTASGVNAATALEIENDLSSYIEDKWVGEAFIPTAGVWLSYLF